eukprot:SAG11_NODE_288_length_11198_cov_29.339130_7_plen_336_part_00
MVSKSGKELHYHLFIWTTAAVCTGSMLLYEQNMFPAAREEFELGCFVSNTNTIARSINYGVPMALSLHYYACYYYFFNEKATLKAKAIPLHQSRGTGYILGAEDLRLLGASSQRMAKYNLRVSVTLRQYLIVIMFSHMWHLADIFVRTTVENRLIYWLYFLRTISVPMKAILSAAVFESRGRFLTKYRNKLQRKLLKKHRTLKRQSSMYSSANAGTKMLTSQGEKMVMAGQRTTFNVLMGVGSMDSTKLKHAGEISGDSIKVNSTGETSGHWSRDDDGLAAEMRQFAYEIQSRTIGVAHRTRGLIVWWLLKISRQVGRPISRTPSFSCSLMPLVY